MFLVYKICNIEEMSIFIRLGSYCLNFELKFFRVIGGLVRVRL